MDYYEVEGKRLLESVGIQTDCGFLISETTDLSKIKYPCVVKAQVLSGKRGKAGGIKVVNNLQEIKTVYQKISGMTINGKAVAGVLVTPKAEIAEEHYIGLTIDSRNKSILLIYSPCGGMDIEEVAASMPEKLLKFPVLGNFQKESFRKALSQFDMGEEKEMAICKIGEKLYHTFVTYDCTTIEINPLARLSSGVFCALDCKLVIDDNALDHHDELIVFPRENAMSKEAKAASEKGLSYVEITDDGGIGMVAGGAGIGMATVDAIKFYGGTPFNFMDLGGGVTAEKVFCAVKLLLENPKCNSILVNVFGGINNCLDMAQGVTRAIRETGSQKLVVVKSRGFNQEEGWALYHELNIPQTHYGTTDDAVKLLLKIKEERAV